MFERFARDLNLDVGTVQFKVRNHNLFDKVIEPKLIDKIEVNQCIFLLQIEPNLKLLFQHISPIYGTRMSRVDITKIPPGNEHVIVFTWSPSKITLTMGIVGIGFVQGDYIKI